VPREGVPYPERMLCSLKCELKNIWTALSGKLHSVNGVEGDGQGNVNIVSGDAAVVVTADPSLNQIKVSLDQSQLPAAAVSSVNGETGAVVLDASEIGSSGSSDVQTDINALKAADVTLQGNITAEATARGNADAALQTNINTVQAGIPGAAAAAVAADPTVAQLIVDMNDKVDVSDVAINETPNTIAKRNGSGRLVAADPASGATDKTLVTANWVSQTGDNAPNNLVHKTGNENRPSGILSTQYIGMNLPVPIAASAIGVWIRWVQFNSAYSENNLVEMIGRNANNGTFYAMFAVAGGGAFSRYAKIIEAGPNNAGYKVAILRNTNTSAHEIWIYAAQTQTNTIAAGLKYGNPARIVEINEEYAALPTTGYTTPFYVLGSP